MALENIEPKIIWKNFSALNSIPRPSKKEEKVVEFIRKFGENLGLETTVDEVMNVIIRKPATPGMENRKPIVLQSHLDMVVQKNSEVEFDFDTQGIEMFTDGDWVRAKGTTLGADNGLGVAAIMSVLESKDIPHPALEALFTIDEETGMTGALGLKPGTLHGEILLNLDTEEDDEIDIGCAGGVDVTASATFSKENNSREAIAVSVKGLQGGHSGMDIHKGLGNANVILFRILADALSTQEIRLASIDSGGLRNAIPREGKVVLAAENAAEFLAHAKKLAKDIQEEFKTLEPALSIEFTSAAAPEKVLSAEDSRRFILAVKSAHNGVWRMSPDVPGLVESSNNIARIELQNGQAKIANLTRSSIESGKKEVADQLTAAYTLGGFSVELSGAYPGWKPLPGSEIVQVMKNLYQQKFGEEPAVVACHAGLECGIIGANYPEMEMVSFGPTIKGAHSPDERASISSTQKFWAFLKEILANIPAR